MPPESTTDSTAENRAPANRPKSAPMSATVVGYIDSIKDQRVCGWAWDRARPNSALEVEIRQDGRPLATGRADRFRKDLEREGIGDGRHAFEITLDQPAPLEKHRVSAVARADDQSAFTPLINRTVEPCKIVPTPTDPATTVPVLHLRRWLDELQTSQRAFEGALKAASNDVREALRSRSVAAAAETKEIVAAIEDLRATQQQLTQQMAALEVFQARFDATLSGLGRSAPNSQPDGTRGDRGLRVAVAALAALSIASLALGLWSVLN